MRGIVIVGFICGLGVGIAGCANPNTRPTHLEFGTSINDTVVMGPALRMVMERDRQISEYQPPLPTICTEPSPDVAIAFSRSLSGQGNFSEPNGPTVGGNFNAQANEAATPLVGRTAGVLALRDGLYAACQSYVNGVLGHDAYAMILSQYGNLLVALAGTGTGGNPTAYTSQDAAISAMLVACLSEHDPTRIRPIKINHQPDVNPLLSLPRCKALLNSIAAGKLLAPPKKAAARGNNEAEVVGAGEKHSTTTVTTTLKEKVGPPAK